MMQLDGKSHVLLTRGCILLQLCKEMIKDFEKLKVIFHMKVINHGRKLKKKWQEQDSDGKHPACD